MDPLADPDADPDPDPGRDLGLASVANLRDLGGYTTRDGGVVRHGLAYRSTALHRLDGADAEAFARLGIRTIVDLRTEVERAREPDRLPVGAGYLVADVLRDSSEMNPAALMGLLENPATAAAALGDGRLLAIFEDKYREFVSLGSAREGYRALFLALADDERRPILFHCTSGKDRTGWAAAALLMLLGVPDDLVMRDFLRSNAYVLRAFEPAFAAFRARGGDPELLRPLIDVRPEYLERARCEMRDAYGTIERYFDAGLGIDVAAQARLRTICLRQGP